MSREDLIKRIEALSDDELRRVAPFLENDLDLLSDPAAMVDLDAMAAEIRAGQESARTEPLLSNEEVFARLDRLPSKDR